MVQVLVEMQQAPGQGLEAVRCRDQAVAGPGPELPLGPGDRLVPGAVSRVMLVDVLFGLVDQRGEVRL
ncbi:hypothetical protein ACIGW8_29605 [Streptomyces sioyaensis]|uniref:hypothetical protein n=1 Tax=Streptomyces sioyaensis TaxID=67364 RepID=UPI0037D89AD9